MRDELETRTDCYIDPSSSSPIAALLSHLGLGCSTGGHYGPTPSVWSWFALRHPVSNWLEPSGHLVILFSNVHLLLLFFRLFTHLLIDGSVEGQYITEENKRKKKRQNYSRSMKNWKNWTIFTILIVNSMGSHLYNLLQLFSKVYDEIWISLLRDSLPFFNGYTF